MFPVYVAIGDRGYSKKPTGHPGYIKQQVAANYGWYLLEDIAELVGNQGHTMLPAHLVGGIGQENFASIQLFALDFDGAEFDERLRKWKGQNITFQEVKERAEVYGLHVAFAYKTFNCSDEKPFYKFRVVFVHRFAVTDPTLARAVMGMLKRIFPECDPHCVEVSRMYYGGKGLIYFDESFNESTCMDLVQLSSSMNQVLNKGGHLLRNLYSFGREYDLGVVNGHLALGYLNELSTFGEKCTSDPSINIIKSDGQNSPIFYYKYIKLHQGPARENASKRSKSRRLRVDIDHKKGICRLLDDFLEGLYLGHQELFLILTNLMQLQSGEKIFMETLRKGPYYESKIKKWETDISGYKGRCPMSCSEDHCKYFSECIIAGSRTKYLNMVNKLKFEHSVAVESPEYVSLEEAHNLMEQSLHSAFFSMKGGIHLIKAQTAIGKTRAIVNLVQENQDKKFLIAEPLITMKRELEDALKEAGVHVSTTLSVKETDMLDEGVKQEITRLHTAGMHHAASKFLKDYLENLKKNCPEKTAKIEEIQNIIAGVGGCMDAQVVVTTHAMLLNTADCIVGQFDVVIVDENILHMQILNSNVKIQRSTIQQLAAGAYGNYTEIARKMLGAKANTYYRADWYYSHLPEITLLEAQDEDTNELDNIEENGSENYQDESAEELDSVTIGDDNISDLGIAGSYYFNADADNYQYLCIRKLPQAKKYIVLSATLDEGEYRSYFGRDYEIICYKYAVAKYKGKLIQFTHEVLGRNSLKEKQQVYKIAKEIAGDPSIPIISFKCEETKHELNHYKIHFGNAVGVNIMKGLDMVIIGTPYAHEISYKLPCAYLYGPDCVNGEKICPLVVDYKGRKFRLTTFKNRKLQHYHLHSLEEELEQCIGRARLLREDCKVYLYSAFPCEQAEIHTQVFKFDNEDETQEDSTAVTAEPSF